MRIHATPRCGLLARTVVLALACGLAHAQVATAPPVAPVPPARPDPAPPVSPVPVTPPAQASAAMPATPATPATPAAPATPATPATPAATAAPAAPMEARARQPVPPETTPPAAAANQAAELARGEPVRWYKEDATEEQRLRTQRKEVAAAYEEAKMECRTRQTSERSQCMKDARATYEKELAGIKSTAGVR